MTTAFWDVAQIELEQGRLREAAPHLVEAWQLLLQIGRVEGIAVVGQILGQLLARVERKDDARDVLKRSAEAFRKLGRVSEAEEVDKLIAGISR